MATLALSSSFSVVNRPLSTTALPQQSYVLAIAALQSSYAAAASTPADTIFLYDKADCRTVTRSLDGHAGGISTICAAQMLAGSPNVLLSCGQDGTVKAWDERTGAAGINSKRR